MPLRFCANITTMFPGVECKTSRYQLAKNLGFHAVESWDLYDVPLDELVAAKKRADVQHLLLGSPIGDGAHGDFGLASLPSREEEFLASVDLAFSYARALECPMLNVVAGNPVHVHPEVADLTYRRRMEGVVKKAHQANIVILVEPVSRVMRPDYFLTDIEQAMTLVREFDSPHLRLELDLFHLQLMCGNLTNIIKEVFPWIAHVQIAQAPDRHEPHSPGEINYRYVFSILEHLGYDKWIGCEYIPKGRVEDSLRWIQDFGYTL